MKKLNRKAIFKYTANIIYPLISLGLMLGIWAIAAAIRNNALVLPRPDLVLGRFFSLFGTGEFWVAVGNTIGRTFLCFALSFLIAIILAAVSVLWEPIYRILNPFVSFLRSAPTVAVILIMYAFIGVKSLTIVVGFLISFPLMFSAFYSAINGINPDLKKMVHLYNVKPLNKVFGLYIPSIASCLFDTSKTTLSLTLKIIISAEIITAVADSIGNSINTANLSFEIADLLAWTMVAIFWSYILELSVFGLKKLWEKLR